MEHQPFSAGAAEVDITPPVGLPMDGYMARSGVNQGIHDPLMAQILVLDDGRMRIAIVALDVIAVSAAFSDGLRQALATALETTPPAIMICASHTHAGPVGLQNRFPVGSNPQILPELSQMVTQRLVTGAQTTASRLAPARLVYGVGEISGIGGDRNRPRPAPDPRVTALRVETIEGTPIAIIFHYACHPTILGPQLLYSADFPGAARDRLHQHYPNVPCLYLNGAAGNISTRFSRRDQSFDEVARLGTLLGDHVRALLEQPQESATALGADTITVDLPVRPFPAAATRRLEASGIARIDETRAEGAVIETNLRRKFTGRRVQPAALSILRIGPWKLLGVPGEAFNELAMLPDPFVRVIGYANDYVGYFPTQEAIDAQTYEALSSPYDARAHVMIRDALISKL
jgi:neutral ceramidase